jgi:hypothetical protein
MRYGSDLGMAQWNGGETDQMVPSDEVKSV